MINGWNSSRNRRLLLELHRRRNPALYELAGQYARLQPRDLSRDRLRGWVYSMGGQPIGYAVAGPPRKHVTFHELWLESRGSPNRERVGSDHDDLARMKETRRFLRREFQGIAKTVLVRVASDNSFGLSLVRRYRWPLEAVLVLATRNTTSAVPARPPSDYCIRRYRPGDTVAFAYLHRAAFDEEITPSAYAVWATQPGCEAFVATLGKEVVGFVIAERRRGGQLGDFNLVVARSHQRRGLGKALMSRGIESLRSGGVPTAIADHWAMNTPAAQLYQQLGFVPARTYLYHKVQDQTDQV